MKKILALLVFPFVLWGCAIKSRHEVPVAAPRASVETGKSSSTSSAPVKSAPPKAVVVDLKDLATLEKMTKAVESYVLKNEKQDFMALCKDKRFDCFVDEKIFPAGKKKVPRPVPPYSSGSKMGLQGEKRIQVRYDFYP